MSRPCAALFALALAPGLPAAPGSAVPPEAVIDDRAARVELARLDLRAGRAAAVVAALGLRAGDDPEARAVLAEAYVRLGRFAEAGALYDAQIAAARAPSSALLRAAGDMRLYAGSPAEALPLYRRAAAADPADVASRRALALALAWTGAVAEARPLLEKLARELPSDDEVVRALAQVSAGDPGASARALASLRARAAREPASAAARADLADLEAASGHAAAARSLYAEARRIQNPATGDAFDLRHARARLAWGDFYPAEAAFRAALLAAPADARLRDDLLGLLRAMDRHEERDALLLRWRGPAPAAPAPASVDALAAAFHEAGPFATRDLAFLRSYLGDEGGAPPPADATTLARLAGLYAEQGDFELAVRCLRAARRADAEYFPAWLDLAEFLAIAGHYDEADREFVALAAAFPDNRQVLLKQARSLGWGRRYDESLAAYSALRALNPADPVPLLEQSRGARWAQRRDHAAGLYAEAWREPVDARLFSALRPLLAGVAGGGEALDAWRRRVAGDEPPAHEEPFHFTELFEAELPALAADVPPESAAALAEVRLALRADFLIQRAFWLENRAKQLAWDRRWWRSEETYARLLAVAPGNQEALFDLSQVQAAQGLGDRERATLGRLLNLDANNRLATAAEFRRERRSEPLAFGELDCYRERGRDDLSSIHRLRAAFGGEMMVDDRFRFRAALLDWRDAPDTRPGDARARGFTVGAEGVLADGLTFSADHTHKDAETTGLGSLDTGGARVWVPFKNAFRVGAGVEVREELANAFALDQGIRSTHRWIGAEAALSRRAEIAARADSIDYDDANAGTDFWIAPAYAWTDHPRIFKTTVTFEARDTDKASIYQFAGADLVNIVHPYWTPRDYRGVALTLEWRHDLAADFFIGAQEHWYDLRATFSASNDDNQGVGWAADYAREWRDRWLIRLGLQQSWSEQWDDFRAHARLVFRF